MTPRCAHGRWRDPLGDPRRASCSACAYPIVQTGMGWVSGARLTAATSEAGGLGILASATMTLRRADAPPSPRSASAPTNPFGVNLLPDQPDAAERIELIIARRCRWRASPPAPRPEQVARAERRRRRHHRHRRRQAPRREGGGDGRRRRHRPGRRGRRPHRHDRRPRCCCPRWSTPWPAPTWSCSAPAASSTAVASSPRWPTAPTASPWAPGSCSPQESQVPETRQGDLPRDAGHRHRRHERDRRRAAAGDPHRDDRRAREGAAVARGSPGPRRNALKFRSLDRHVARRPARRPAWPCSSDQDLTWAQVAHGGQRPDADQGGDGRRRRPRSASCRPARRRRDRASCRRWPSCWTTIERDARASRSLADRPCADRDRPGLMDRSDRGSDRASRGGVPRRGPDLARGERAAAGAAVGRHRARASPLHLEWERALFDARCAVVSWPDGVRRPRRRRCGSG